MKRGIQITAAIVAILLVAYASYLALRQEKGPSGASTPPTMPELPGITRNEVTITCNPAIVGARGDLFGAVMNMPRWIGSDRNAVSWDAGYLGVTEEVFREHVSIVGPRMKLRFGYEPFDGFVYDAGKSVQGYHWREALEPGSQQMSIDEYLAYAGRVGAETQVVVNFASGTPQEAADLVAYLNGVDDSDPMVALRRSRGRHDPHGVGVFEIGAIPWAERRGPDGRVPARGGRSEIEVKAGLQGQFARAMRARSATPVKLYVPLTVSSPDIVNESELRRLVAMTAPDVDGYSLRFEAMERPGQPAEDAAMRAAALGELLMKLTTLLSEVAGKKSLEVAVTEWIGSRFTSPMGRNWLTGLVLADSISEMASRGVTLSNYFASASAPGDPTGYSYWIDGDPSRPAPTLVASQVVARHLGRELLETRSSGIEIVQRDPDGTGEKNFPALGTICSRRDNDISLIVVNRTARPRSSNISIESSVVAPIQHTQLVAPPAAETVDVAATTYQPAGKFSLDLPPYSVTLLRVPAV